MLCSAAYFWCFSIFTVLMCSRSTDNRNKGHYIYKTLVHWQYFKIYLCFLLELYVAICPPSQKPFWCSSTSRLSSRSWSSLWCHTPAGFPRQVTHNRINIGTSFMCQFLTSPVLHYVKVPISSRNEPLKMQVAWNFSRHLHTYIRSINIFVQHLATQRLAPNVPYL